jgi:methylmalonyl-CoA/ethylmalonyl-CoA epimerase
MTAPSPAADPGLRRIGQIAITVQDLDRAVAFYRDTLGLRFLFRAPPALAFFDVAGQRLMLTLPEGSGPAQHQLFSSILYYEVGDIQAAAGALRHRGVAFESEPHLVAKLGKTDLWMGFFRDLEGNLLGIMQEMPA